MKVPKHIMAKVVRANRLMGEVVRANMEVEQWLESHGVDDGYDFVYAKGGMESRGYEIVWPEELYKAIEEL